MLKSRAVVLATGMVYAVGRLRVFVNGYLEITCECTPGCQEDKLSPSAFEKHSGRETARKWKNNIWVIVKGEKMLIGNVLISNMTKLHVMMKKNEGAAEYTGDALALRHAKVAPPVSASAAVSAAFQIAAARLVLTSQAMSKGKQHDDKNEF
ncbi:hypothetical protein AHAS_Ahas03G0127900 [Arachis hypogaea]